jgi:hypothetical protein
LFSFLTLKPLWEAPGWPQNHEYDSFAKRTIIYAQHFSFNDFVPIWSSLDNNGFGSPMPLYYHKLYYFLSGLILLTTGDVKLSLILAILFFSVLGAAGVYGVGRELISSRFLASVGSLMFLSANYTVTNWLIRGALAEFSAAMLIPWALMYFIRSLKLARIQTGLAVSLGLIFLGHSVIFYFLILLFGLVLMVMIFFKTTSKGILSIRTLFVPALVFTAITGPYLLVMWAFSSDYDMQRIVPPFYHPMNQFRPMWRYFWNDWIWGKTWEHLTMQLDLPLLLMIVLGGLGSTFEWRNGSIRIRKTLFQGLTSLLPLIILFAMIMALQAHVSATFYEHFPGALYLMFPWRLLGLVTPVMVVMALSLVERAFNRGLATVLACLCLAWMAAFCGAFAPIQYGRLTHFGATLQGLNFSSYGEYVPKVVPGAVAPSYDQILAKALAARCSIEIYRPKSEVKSVAYKCVCDKATSVSLPLFASPYHRLSLVDANGLRAEINCRDNPDFPGLCSVILPAGHSEVVVNMPNIFTVIRTFLSQLLSWHNQ